MPVDDPLNQVITAGEAGQLYGLTKNAIAQAIKRGALRGRFSGDRWMVTIGDLVVYQRGRLPFTDKIPDDLRPSFEQAKKGLTDEQSPESC
jgi:hypothetical protein